MDRIIGRIIAINAAQMAAAVEGEQELKIGSIVKVRAGECATIGTVAAVELDRGASGGMTLGLDFLGEIVPSRDGPGTFHRGVSRYPSVGAPLFAADDADLGIVYAQPRGTSIRLGTCYDDEARVAYAMLDELLGKHFAILGSTGSGKSCCVALILSAIVASYPSAHVVLLDPHNEYASAFDSVAELMSVENLRLPLWLLDFEEACRTLIRGGTLSEQQSQAMILKDAITWARRNRIASAPASQSITVDTPVPFTTFDLLRFINDEMGRLGKPEGATAYLRLRARIESLRDDRRFAFMFSDVAEDNLSDILGRLLRIPLSGKPLTIIDLSGVPAEITDVIVSMLCRTIFDFALWAQRDRMPPVLIVCEEAQRYIPADESVGFAATARAMARIAKEGRKYGLSLALVTQRPSELSAHVLLQCGTVLAMRLADERDQRFVANALPDAPRGMLSALPALPSREAIICGDGVSLPLRVRLDTLPPGHRPASAGARFSQAWQRDSADAEFRDDAIRRWRAQRRESTA